MQTQTLDDVHKQFAEYFRAKKLKPYAYLLSKKLSEGHICLPLDSHSDIDASELPKGYALSPNVLEELNNEPLVSFDRENKQPFVVYNNKMYLQRYFHYETVILERIQRFLQLEKNSFKDRAELLQLQKPFIRALFRTTPPKIAEQEAEPEWQLAAAMSAVLNDFTIITGGPGTGKTTTVAKILTILIKINPDLKVALAAPTGKAAARMAESLKGATLPVEKVITQKLQEIVPSTIHRLLKSIKGSSHFRHCKENPLNFDAVIIDESSMIDVAMFAKLVDAIGDSTKLILLGDKDQLASVEAGSLFGDICQGQEKLNIFSVERAQLINGFIENSLFTIGKGFINSSSHPLFQHIVELRKSHRFNDHEGIGRFSKAVIENNADGIRYFFQPEVDGQVTIDVTYSKEIFQEFTKGYTEYISEPDIKTALKKLNNCRVLCAVREGEQGVYAINKAIEDQLLHLKLIRKSGEFYENRPIMVTSNDYELGLFNGDVGIIRNNTKGVPMAYFEDAEGNVKQVLPGYISQAETVFAMTIHKSQGSEFNNVLVILPEKEEIKILTRELLYTAVTRAKKHVVIQSTKETIIRASGLQVSRASGINDRFNEL